MSILTRLAVVASLLIAVPAEARVIGSAFEGVMLPYEDKNLGFKLKYPGGWKVSKGDKTVCFYAEGKKPGEAMFITRPVQNAKPISALLQEAKTTKGATVNAVKLHGMDAVRMDLEATSGGKQYHARTYWVVTGRYIFNVTMRCAKGDYGGESVVFDNIGKSLEFAK